MYKSCVLKKNSFEQGELTNPSARFERHHRGNSVVPQWLYYDVATQGKYQVALIQMQNRITSEF